MTTKHSATVTPGAHATPGGGQWAYKDELAPFHPVPGMDVRATAGTQVMSCWIDIAPHTELAEHEHPHEQIGVVVEGAVHLTMDGETRRVGPGGAYIVPGGMRHAARTGDEGVRIVESFAPVRENFLEMAQKAAAGE